MRAWNLKIKWDDNLFLLAKLQFLHWVLDLAFIIKAGAASWRFDRNMERLSLSGEEIDVEWHFGRNVYILGLSTLSPY